MAYKFLAVLALLATAKTNDFNLQFEEKGGEFTEAVKVDKQKGIVEYDVPDHGSVAGSKYLTDFNLRLNIMKVDKIKKCLAMKIPKEEPTPDNVEAGLKHFHGKFPNQKYWIENLQIMQLGEMDRTELSPEILHFCGNYPIIKVGQYTIKEMEKIALEDAKAKKSGRSKRKTVTEFIACDLKTQLTIGNCPQDKLIAICKFVVGSTCVYRVSCNLSQTGWNCPGAHRFHILHCCDYACKK